MRVIIFSQVRLYREILTAALSDSKDITEVHICDRLNTLTEQISEFTPDIVLLDIAGEDIMNEACKVNESYPDIQLLALAIAETPNNVIACAEAGFVGYIPYDASLDELCEIMQHAQHGECICHPKIANSLFREVRRRRSHHLETDPDEPLTHREREVLSLIVSGLSNKQIARKLVLSVATVKNHVHNTFTKLHVKCRTEACARVRNKPWLASTSTDFDSKMVNSR